MDRAYRIPESVGSLAELASAAELAIDELFHIMKRGQLPPAPPQDTEGGEVFYVPSSDPSVKSQLFVFNKLTGEYDTFEAL